jgi:NitT/TauT family transport system substrate-binding protein
VGRMRRILIPTVLAVMTCALAANCGQSSAGDREEDVSAGVLTVRSIKTTPTLAFLPLLYALEKGLFAQKGVQLDERPDATSSTAPIQAMLAGQADIIWIGTSAVPAARLAGQDVRCLADHFAGNAYQLALTNKAIAGLAKRGVTRDSPVQDRVDALRGLTIATNGPGNTVDSMLRATLGKFGVRESAVSIRGIPDPLAMAAAAREGQLDGFMFVPPITTMAELGGYGRIWVDYTADVPEWRAMPGGCVAATPTFINKHPEALTRVLAALDLAYDEITADPQAAKETMGKSKYFSQLDQALYSAGFDAVVPMLNVGPMPTQEGFSALMQIFNSDASLPKQSDASFNDIFDVRLLKSVTG